MEIVNKIIDKTIDILGPCELTNSVIFNTLRILKKVNPGDTYLENYMGHYKKQGAKFFDTYHLMWVIGSIHKPKRILEIGVRTGISICQLLSAYIDHSIIERITLCDVFNDGFTSPEVAKINLRHLNIPDTLIDKIEWLVGDSKALIPKLEGEYNYILVDGDHTKESARIDLDHATKLIAKHGFILFDDLTKDGCDLQDVWNEFKEKYKDDFVFNENHFGKGVGWGIRK